MTQSDTTSRTPLLTGDFMRRLDRLDIASRKILRGRQQGERRSKRRGQSVEFADYRNYVVGDDLRRIDWNLFARLDKLFLRLFMEEEDLSVSLVIDVTASMRFGEPNKLLYARRLAAALGYIALVHYNRVNFYAFTDRIVGELRGLRGRRPVPRMVEWLQEIGEDAPTDPAPGDLEAALRRFALAERSPGVVIVVSDFFEKGDLYAATRYLADERYDAYALQILSPQERDPAQAAIVGDLRLRDSEDGNVTEVSVTAALMKRYRETLDAYILQVRETCLRRNVAHFLAETNVPFEQVVLTYLRQSGLVR